MRLTTLIVVTTTTMAGCSALASDSTTPDDGGADVDGVGSQSEGASTALAQIREARTWAGDYLAATEQWMAARQRVREQAADLKSSEPALLNELAQRFSRYSRLGEVTQSLYAYIRAGNPGVRKAVAISSSDATKLESYLASEYSQTNSTNAFRLAITRAYSASNRGAFIAKQYVPHIVAGTLGTEVLAAAEFELNRPNTKAEQFVGTMLARLYTEYLHEHSLVGRGFIAYVLGAPLPKQSGLRAFTKQLGPEWLHSLVDRVVDADGELAAIEPFHPLVLFDATKRDLEHVTRTLNQLRSGGRVFQNVPASDGFFTSLTAADSLADVVRRTLWEGDSLRSSPDAPAAVETTLAEWRTKLLEATEVLHNR